MKSSLIDIKPEVATALENNEPVVALESTIIAHGMPYPQNLQVARELENIARENGTTPATICLLKGKVKIGITPAELKYIATAPEVEKVSRRDIGKVLAQKGNGATTVASTMYLAHKAGIQVFATGGIGGVHHNAEKSFDLSADLLEFSQTPLVVVSAGAKAILDLAKTLEVLETLGVPVLGYKTDKFPAFYSASSPYNVEKVNSVRTIAGIFRRNLEIGLKSGMLIANPINQEFEIPYAEMKNYIQKAIDSADAENVSGKELTPYLLQKISEITDDKSLATNIELVKSNVKLASEISKGLVK